MMKIFLKFFEKICYTYFHKGRGFYTDFGLLMINKIKKERTMIKAIDKSRIHTSNLALKATLV